MPTSSESGECRACGMQLEPDWPACPKCDTPAGAAPDSAARSGPRAPQGSGPDVWTVDVGHAGLAAAEVAGALDDACSQGLLAGATLLRIVHGYGSGGHGGTLRDAARRHCRHLAETGAIRAWIAGEDLTHPPPAAWQAAARHDGHNPGVTLVRW